MNDLIGWIEAAALAAIVVAIAFMLSAGIDAAVNAIN